MSDKPRTPDGSPHDSARALLADAFGVDQNSLPDGVAIGTFERWDSLAHVRVVLGLEELLDRPVGPLQKAAFLSSQRVGIKRIPN